MNIINGCKLDTFCLNMFEIELFTLRVRFKFVLCLVHYNLCGFTALANREIVNFCRDVYAKYFVFCPWPIIPILSLHQPLIETKI